MTKSEFNGMRYAVGSVWLVTGCIVLWLYPIEGSVELVNRLGLHGHLAYAAVYSGASLDLLMGLLTLLYPNKKLWAFQFLVISAYSLCIAIFLPEFLVHPFGPVLKNIPLLIMLYLLYSDIDHKI